jgi:acid stress-induced BolA-like protein IbaG/YrbA
LNSNQIRELLLEAMPDCEVVIEGSDGKYLVTAIGDVFQGLTAVKRQQIVYQILNEHIVSGVIHAVTMRLMTAEERSAS